jgi:hypothetical protein
MDGVGNACSEPPAGCARWTLRLLEKNIDSTIGRVLKKRT